MKEIQSYIAEKYVLDKTYEEIVDEIYKKDGEYYTSISFIQESEYGEGNTPREISQYPIEDILEHFFVYISDFYVEKNRASYQKCYCEFASSDIADIQNLRKIIGKHVFNRQVGNQMKLIIE